MIAEYLDISIDNARTQDRSRSARASENIQRARANVSEAPGFKTRSSYASNHKIQLVQELNFQYFHLLLGISRAFLNRVNAHKSFVKKL